MPTSATGGKMVFPGVFLREKGACGPRFWQRLQPDLLSFEKKN